MSTKDKIFIVTIPDDIEDDAAEVKRDLFCDMSYSEMYRLLIRLGLDSLKAIKGHPETPCPPES